MDHARVRGGLAAALTGAAALAGSYVVTGGTRAFVATPLSDVLVRDAPPWLVTFSITRLGYLGDSLVAAAALALTGLALGALTHVAFALALRIDRPLGSVVGAPLLVAAATDLVTGSAVSAAGAALPTAAVALLLVGRPESGSRPLDPSRRRLLQLGVGVAGFAGLAAVLGPRFAGGKSTSPLGIDVSQERRAADRAALSNESLVPSFTSSRESFYTVDIDLNNPAPSTDAWSLTLHGAVKTPVEVDYAALRNADPVSAYDTLRCVSDSVSGKLIDTALWTGVPLARYVDRAAPHADASRVVATCADGYEVAFPRDALSDAFLAYGMNGHPLPRGHGRPVRLLVPGHWGEANAKWVTDLRFTTEAVEGYWEKRGWHGTGPVEPVAKIRGTRVNGNHVAVGGVAYAGTRGVAHVQVSPDGGDTWRDATLSGRLPDALTVAGDVWRQWRYEWTSAAGSHTVLARVVTDDGTVQSPKGHIPYPSGATGYDKTTINV